MAEPELSRTVLYNETTGGTTTVPDTRDGYLSGQTLISSGAGWKWAPVEPEARPGEQPEAVTFVPQVPEGKPEEPEDKGTTKATTKAASKPKEGDS